MANIQPTQNFVLIEFVAKDGGGVVIVPDGARDPSDKITVLAVGPDVPKVPAIDLGATILVRGDTKFYGVDDKSMKFLVDSRWITAVVDDAILTDAQIEQIAAGTKS